VTSRNRLTGLVAGAGAFVLTLDTLSTEDARETLVRRLGVERANVESEAVEEIIELCGRLPLALAIVPPGCRQPAISRCPRSSRSSSGRRARWPVPRRRRAGRTYGLLVVLRILSPEAAQLFRLLCCTADGRLDRRGGQPHRPGPRETSDLLDELTRTRFSPNTGRDGSSPRPDPYLCHRAAQAVRLAGRATRGDGRLLDYYLSGRTRRTCCCARIRSPRHPAARPGVIPETIINRADAMEWFTDERMVHQ